LPTTLLPDEADKLPVVHAGESVIKQLFVSVDSLRNLQKQIDAAMKPHSIEIAGVVATIKTSTIVVKKPAGNVIGYLPGADPQLRNQYVVIGAHYDHIGTMRGVAQGADSIFNGADDNASGTSGMLAIARAFGMSSQKPKRSVLFMAFAGEEKGLLGSRSYVDRPLVPIEQTVAMLNLDMIGRNAPDTLTVVATSRSPDIAHINEEENKSIGFVFKYDDKVFGASDHASFFKKNVPILFYFTDVHGDYHKVTDHPELINTAKAANVARLAYKTAWRIANEDRTYRIVTTP
jgi:Zn-dependent M28 family amino/carboxypeptidase